MNKRFEGKVAVITGGTTGIGLATAENLSLAGAKVCIAGRNAESGEAAIEQIRTKGGEATFVQTDVSQIDQVEHLMKATIDTYGDLHYAFNNAALEHIAPISQTTEEIFDQMMSINVKGVWLCMKYQIEHMLKTGGGVIVNTSSVAGGKGMAGFSAYSASKHAVNGLTKSLALECAESGIRINGIMPGPIATPMMKRVAQVIPHVEQALIDATAVKRIGNPAEVADAVAWLFSDEASFVNAAIIPVDGGMFAL